MTDTTYSGVIHRKVRGIVILTAASFIFQPDDGGDKEKLVIPWCGVVKHQVSPASHPKCLLRVLLNGGASKAFQLAKRADLDKIRKDVSGRLGAANGSTVKKRKRNGNGGGGHVDGDLLSSSTPKHQKHLSFDDLDPDALAVARSSLLSSDPTLRHQHKHLVEDTKTVTEEDFWTTPNHARAVMDEYAKIAGRIRNGMPSSIRSNLDLGPRGRVRLGVEEMRQIFLMYPAVHKAYEEKVPLELSEEQFWRKYLESEFFHRDRGRIGVIGNQVGKRTQGSGGIDGEGKTGDENGGKKDNNVMEVTTTKEDEAAARIATAGSNDLFLRLEDELKQEGGAAGAKSGGVKVNVSSPPIRKTRMAAGQFDLAATAASDRGERVLNATDLHPAIFAGNNSATGRVIGKYNKHWAIVLDGQDSSGNSKRKVFQSSDDNNSDAKIKGDFDAEMFRLVDFADAPEENADHVHGLGTGDDKEGLYEELLLNNIGAYSGRKANVESSGDSASAEGAKKLGILSKALAESTSEMAAQVFKRNELTNEGRRIGSTFPPAALGKELLGALTKRMSQSSQADTDASNLTSGLPKEFREKLNSYFRRSSELLRHFYGIRETIGRHRREEDVRKLSRIVKGMEKVYREMEKIRKDSPQSKAGDAMRKMCVPNMEQLDWAFKLHRDTAGAGGGGGFVTVEDL